MTALEQRVLLTGDDGSRGPLLRLADDRLPPGAGYGGHAHRAVDVVAVVLSGSLEHRWQEGTPVRAGDVAVLRAGTGLEHDEVAGDDGARVLQAYLRAVQPAAAPSHRVVAAPGGWVDLGRPDARLWLARPAAGEDVDLPPGLLVAVGGGAVVRDQPGGRYRAAAAGTLLVWQLDATRPAWALD